MSIKHFGRHAEGQIPEDGTAKGVIMGKPGSVDILAEQIGHGLNVGHIDVPGIAVAAKAAHVEIVEPPSYVKRDENAHYTTKYKYDALKNENIGGGPS